MNVLIRQALLPCVALLLTCMVHGQATGTIQGTVTDASGGVMGGADVEVKNAGTGILRNTPTDDQGRYRAPELGIGNYEVTARKVGFSSASRTGVTLTVGAQLVVDFQLAVGQQTQTITVEGQVSQVETQSTAVGVLVESKQIRDLPLNGRNYTQLIALNPGVTQISEGSPGAGNQFYGNGTKYSIAGSRPSGQNYLLDGTDMTGFWNNGPGAAGLGTALGVEAIAEFQTLTNTFTAQFGGNGAVINASSRSGTNAFHGSLYEYLRNNKLEARNFFDNQRPPFRQNQYGASLGGPLKSNKAFFFGNYESLRSTKLTAVPVVVPDDNARNFLLPDAQGRPAPVPESTNTRTRQSIRDTLALYPRAESLILSPAGLATGTGNARILQHNIGTQHYFLGRIDYTFSEKSSLFLRYVRDQADRDFGGGAGRIPWWPERETTRSHFVTVEERHIFSPRLVNLARFAFTRPAETGASYGSPSVTNGVPTAGELGGSGNQPLQFLPGRQNGIVNLGSGINSLGPAGALPFYLIQNKFQMGDDVIWTSGAHNVRVGVNAVRLRENTWAPHRNGSEWTFGNLPNFLRGLPQQVVGQVSDQQNPAGDATRDYRYWMFGFYIDDQWKAHRKLTVNLGLRYAPTTRIATVRHSALTLFNPPFGVFENTGYTSAANPSLANWDPRVGLAWDPFADHKTSIRAGFGVFHNPIMSRENIQWFQPPLVQANQSATDGATYPTPFTNVPVGAGLVIPLDGTLSINQAGNNYTVNTTPYQMQWNFNIQRELVRNSVLSVGYVGSRNIKLFLQRDLNTPIPFIGPSGRQTFGVLNAAGTAVVANRRINPAYNSLALVDTQGWSSYHALQTSFTRRFTGGWQSQVSYTWSKSIDNASGTFGLDGGAGGGGEQNPVDLKYARGLSNFNRKHNLRISGIYEFPFRANGALGKLVQGWQVTSIYSYLSGLPISPTATPFSVHNSNGSNTGRPDVVAGCKVYPEVQTRLNWFNPGCFAMQPLGTFGNAGRSSLLGPNLWVMDSSLLKDTHIERISSQFVVQFRAEVFNLLNHASFQNPNSGIFNNLAGGRIGNAGQINATNSQPRQIQLSLKILF